MAKVLRIENEETRIERYNDVMSNIKPMLTKGRGRTLHSITGSACVPLDLCYVDARYQGMRKHNKINKLDRNWDERKLSNITLVPHPEEHRFAIVDGQGRSIVATRKGVDRLWATILLDAPDNPEERLKFEAEYFIGQDLEVENVKPFEKHLARVILGEEAAVVLDGLLKKYKISFVTTKGQREESILGSYTDTYGIAKAHGEKCLDFIFSIIENAGWNKESNGYATFVMRALRDVWIAHPNNREQIHKYLSEELRQLSPTLFGAVSKTRYPKRDHRVSCILYVEDMVVNGLGIEQKIYADDKKCKLIK